MSTSSHTTWIDLTDLSLWRGHHTGIQRVVYKLALRYARDESAKFFVYEEKTRSFFEVEFSSIQPPVTRPPEISSGRRLKEETVSQARNFYTRLPESWRKVLTPKLKPIASQAYNSAHHLAYTTKKQLRRAGRREIYRPAVFRHGDEIILLGAGWARPTILTELYRLKLNVSFKVYHFVHDVIPVFYPHLFGPGHFELFANYMFDLAQVTDKIITNSVASKNDTEKFFADLLLPSPPVSVIRLGDELDLKGEVTKPSVPIEPGKFILAAGTIEVRKNYALLYMAYKLAKTRNIELPKLVIMGQPGWNAGDTVFAMKNDPEVDNLIVILKNTPDSELAWLYENARFSVYPSLYEGWGLPIAEALVHGKVSLGANISSMPEIAGDLIDYFNPYDAADCLTVMVKYLDDDVLATAEERIRREYKVTTWDETYDSFKAAVAN